MKAFSRNSGKILVLLLMLAMLFVTACNRNNEEDPDEAGTTNVNGGTANGPVVTDPDAPTLGGIHQPRDMGGRTLIGASPWGGSAINAANAFWDEEPDPATATNYHTERLIWDNGVRVREEFNVNIESVQVEEIMAALTISVLAGDALADSILLPGGYILSGIIGDLLVPISSINLPASDVLGSRIYASPGSEFQGQYYSVHYNGINNHIPLIGVNLDLIRAIGAPNPVDLFNAGQWTWDAALDIMRMATRDTTGDGIMNQFGIAGQPADILRHFVAANDGFLVDDNMNYAFDHPHTIEALEFLEIIFREGLWDYDREFGANIADWGRNFFSFQNGDAALFHAILWGIGEPSFDFAIVPYPIGPSNNRGYTWGGGWGASWVIPHATTNWEPEEVLIILEELFSWPDGEPELIAEGQINHARTIWPTEEDVQRQILASHSGRLCVGGTVPEYYWIFGNFAGHFLEQSMTVLQAIEAYRPTQQELLDNFFGR